jgi:hypothetical protein
MDEVQEPSDSLSVIHYPQNPLKSIAFQNVQNRYKRLNDYLFDIRMCKTRYHSWLKHCATSRKVADSIPDPSSRTTSLGSTQPLTEMSTRNLPGGKGWSVHKADNLTAICELIV